jgi:uncharacterized protein with LGFP repeats
MRTMRKLQASASAVACAAAACLATLIAAQPALASTSCVPTMLIGVHGTGEETGVIGNELANLYNGVVAHTGLPEQGLSGWQDDSTLLTDVAAGVAAYPVDGGLLLKLALAKLQTAVDTGATDLYNQITNEALQCPGEHFVVAGFSQGAAVVGEFARKNPSLAGRVSGVILWADPNFNGDDSFSKGAVANGGYVGTGGWLGVLGWYNNQRLTFPSSWSGRLRSYCTTLDPVCNWSLSTFAGFGHHGDERYSPIIGDSEYLIQGPGSGWAPSVWDTYGSNDFYTKWQSLGGMSGLLGRPTADAVNEPGGGTMQTFSGTGCGSSGGSALFWSSASNSTHEMHGCIYNSFMNRWGGPGGTYGYPTSDEESTSGGRGRINYMTGTLCGSTAGSALVFGSPEGTYPAHGCIYQRYLQIGEDNSGIGLPKTDEYGVSGGVQQDYTNGDIRDIGGSITVTVFNSTALDDTDPYQTGCAGAQHPESTVASTTDGPTVIDLQWSGFCGTNWSRVIPNVVGGRFIDMAIWVQRLESNGSITSSDTFEFIPNGTVPAWSDQLYAPVLHARACENYYIIPDKMWSTPVCTAWV